MNTISQLAPHASGMTLDEKALKAAGSSHLDEGAVTPAFRQHRDDIVRLLNDALGLTSIVVSHDLEETFRVADQVIILGAGGVAAQGTPAEVMANPDPLVQQFVHAQPIGPVPFHYPAPSLAQDFGGQP